jgi:peptide deformylase
MPVKPETLQIVHYPDPVLRKKAKAITSITDEVKAVAARMIELMHESRGVGLAAPQVGLSWRLFVANATGDEEDDQVFINPVLKDAGEEVEPHEEGCLSIPGVRVQVRRPKVITVEATDLDGNAFSMTSDDLDARIWQHETDHLNGVLILDKMTAMDKLAVRRTLKDLEARYEDEKA